MLGNANLITAAEKGHLIVVVGFFFSFVITTVLTIICYKRSTFGPLNALFPDITLLLFKNDRQTS